jgi:hypothetical protein
MSDMNMPDSAQPIFTKRTSVTAILLVLACGAMLYWSGRPTWCKYGFGVWSSAWSHCTSQHLLDPYSFSHVLHGIIFYWLLWPLRSRYSLPARVLAALALEIGWELLENTPWVIERYRQQTASLDYMGDSIINSLSDIILAVLGFIFASRFSWKVSVAVFVAFELWMLVIARDNLTLNVFMLFFPLEAIKHWQMPS